MTAPSAAPRPPVSRWRLPHLLGLDAVAVALIWLTAFGGVKGARLERVEYWALGVAVWILYIGDRLFDHLRPPLDGDRPRERHAFAARHWKWLLPLLLAAGGAAVTASLYHMRTIVVRQGAVLVSLTGCYYALTWLSRDRAVGKVLVWLVCGGLVLALLGLRDDASFAARAWRAISVGALGAALLIGMKDPSAPAPWILPRKLIGGYLFSLGCALAPYAHLDDREGLLLGAPVIFFGACCAMNSLGIRLWEKAADPMPGAGPSAEEKLLTGLYPWLCAALCSGALSEALRAGPYSRTALAPLAAAFALLAGLHFLRRRLSGPLIPALADGTVALAGIAAIFLQRK